MTDRSNFWDYLIVTASNDRQSSAYEAQLRIRRAAGQLPRVGEALVVADLEGRRIGSGASTLDCLARVVNAERRKRGTGSEPVRELLGRLRILIIHAGGDSRRLPAYGPAGKIFVPLPGASRGGTPMTLFDRLAPSFFDLGSVAESEGQVVVTAGDALNEFDSSSLEFGGSGLTMVGCYATPEEASRHGVYCVGERGALRLYLQKPSIAVQAAMGAISAEGKSVLDIGVMSFDASAADVLLRAFGLSEDLEGTLDWSPSMRETILARGVDLYREICCALGADATLEHYIQSARASGSRWDDNEFAAVFPQLREIPANVRVVPSCRFLHFGSTRQLVPSGAALAGSDCLSVNNEVDRDGRIDGREVWVEGCRIAAPLMLAGRNAVIGVDVCQPLSLPTGACLEVLAGSGRNGAPVWFVRPYGIDDTFKHTADHGGTFCGRPIWEWLQAVGVRPEAVWDRDVTAAERTLWNARVFPGVPEHGAYREWLWYWEVDRATAAQKRAFLDAERYSAADVALLADQSAFHERRMRISAKSR